MMIQPTSIQVLELREQGRIEDEIPVLVHDRGWRWETSTSSWRATDGEAADALLERLCELEGQVLELRARAQLGDALQQALQATELLETLDSGRTAIVIGDVETVDM